MRTGFIALMLCGVTDLASAAPIVYSFTGTLTGGAPVTEADSRLRELTAGDHFSGSFWYSFNQAPLPEGAPGSGIYSPSYLRSYAQPGLIFSLGYEITFDTFSIFGQGGMPVPGTAPVVRITDGTLDGFALSDWSPDSSIARRTIDQIALALDFSSSAFADRSLPSLLDPAAFLGGTLRFSVLPNPCTACYDVAGTIDTLQARAVPEPTGIVLGVLGLSAAVAAKRRRSAATNATNHRS